MRIFSIVLSGLVHEQVKLDNELERLVNDKTLHTDDLVSRINDVLEKQVIVTMKLQKWQEVQKKATEVIQPENNLETKQ